MSQNVTVQGATYSDVPGIELPKQGGGTAYFADTSDANAAAADISSGKTAYVNGVKITGTGSGGGGGVVEDDVNFFDYDGTLLYSYSAADFANLSALPANPSHTGLTAQGWNWTLADAKTFVSTYGTLDIGQTYKTDDGKTRIHWTVLASQLTMFVRFKQSVANGVTVDWGDGTVETFSGTTMTTKSHTYAAAGDYVCTLLPASGVTISIAHTSNTNTFFGGNTVSTGSRQNVTAVEFGDGHTSDYGYAFYGCYSLKSVIVSPDFTQSGSNAFGNCRMLRFVVIPKGNVSSGSTYSNCYVLERVVLPKVSELGASTFSGCRKLKHARSLLGITSVNGTLSLSDCYSYEDGTFLDFKTSTFSGCNSLKKATIPSGNTEVKSKAFKYCYGLEEVHVKPTTPPTLSADSFQDVPLTCKFYVPTASLATYKAETNWATYADQMVGE